MNSRKIKSLKTRYENLERQLVWALDDLKHSIVQLEGTLILGGVLYLGVETAERITDAVKVVNAKADRFTKLIKREESLSEKIKAEQEAE